ncbi:hypothetical protein [Olivibacter sp. XZL3]|nr:hypothetical protein [Olivibacter sp. XZL3]
MKSNQKLAFRPNIAALTEPLSLAVFMDRFVFLDDNDDDGGSKCDIEIL